MERYISYITQDIHHGIAILFVCLVTIAVACMMDLWTGIEAARANKEKVRSKPLRRTGAKMLDYYRIFVVFVLIDVLGLCFPWYGLPYAAIICTVAVISIEGLSIVENVKKKKSHAADVAEVAKNIIECLTKEDAEKIIKSIKEEKKRYERN